MLTRETGAHDSRAAHQPGDTRGSAIGRAILGPWVRGRSGWADCGLAGRWSRVFPAPRSLDDRLRFRPTVPAPPLRRYMRPWLNSSFADGGRVLFLATVLYATALITGEPHAVRCCEPALRRRVARGQRLFCGVAARGHGNRSRVLKRAASMWRAPAPRSP